MAYRSFSRWLLLSLALGLGPLTDTMAAEIFEPDPRETSRMRKLTKVPQPRFDSKKRERTTYLFFDPGSTLLKNPESFRQLDAAGRAFRKALEVGKTDNWVIEVAAHTDNVESPESNMKLSMGRAENVRSYLIENFGLPPNMVIAQGYGEAQPIVSNNTPEGREKNRRIVFRVKPRTPFETGLAAFQSGNYDSALNEWRGIAEQGNAGAQFWLGILYANGKGAPQDYRSAAEWFHKAAKQGHVYAQYNLGQMYFEGLGVTQDFVFAYMWTNISSAQGFMKAGDFRDTISSKMTPGQIAESQKLVREWKPKK